MKAKITLLLCFLSIVVSAQFVNIPNANFKAYLVGNPAINTNGNSEIEIEEAKLFPGLIDCSNLNIDDLTGIEAFISLTKLYCSNNQLPSINIASNTKLEELDCSQNQITALNVNSNVNLIKLYCSYNPLGNLNILNNTLLEWLYCIDIQITNLNLNSNTALTRVNCGSNQLTSLNVSNNTALNYLYCQSNQITSLDVSSNASLQRLYCNSNQLTSLNVANGANGSLTLMKAYGNSNLSCVQIDQNFTPPSGWSIGSSTEYSTNCNVSFDITPTSKNFGSVVTNTSVTQEFTISNDGTEDLVINTFNLSGTDASQFSHNGADNTTVAANSSYNFTVTFTPTSLGSKSATLEIDHNVGDYTVNLSGSGDCLVDIPDANFKSALVAHSPTIDTNGDGKIQCSEAQALNVGLDVSNKNITNLTGIEAFININQINCEQNQLTSLDVSSNTKITSLFCYDNQLTSLNVADLTILATLNCKNNQLASIDVNTNSALTQLDCFQNSLTAIDVSSNTGLLELNCYENQLTELNVAQNTALTKLTFQKNQVTTIDLSQNTNLATLNCSENSLTGLDISSNPNLTTVNCKQNELTSLNISGANSLINLYCNDNQLTNIDISSNTSIEKFHCINNQLTSLNVANGNNTNIVEMKAFVNADLNCIQIDGGFTPPAGTGWQKDNTASYSDNCSNPLFAITPTSKNFGDIAINETATQQFTITNNGGNNLIISTFALSGANVSDFAQNATNNTTIAPNATYQFNVTFTPSSLGTKVATLTITDNTTVGTHTVSLNGNGVTPQFTINPTSKDFGNVQTGQQDTQQFTITNNGTTDLIINDFILNGSNASEFSHNANNNITISPNDTYQFTITFSPLTLGNKSASLAINHSAGNDSVALTGNAVNSATPNFVITPTSKDFGSVQTGQTATQVFTITNNGNANLNILGFSLSGANANEFSDNGTAKTIPPNGTYDVTVTFEPTSVGSKVASLDITDNDGNHTVALSGIGIAPSFSINPTSKDFGSLATGQTATQVFTITNNGTADLLISAFSLSGSHSNQFSHNGTAQTIAPNGTYDVTVTFAPTSVGNKTANFNITNNAGNYTVALNGTGITSSFSINPTSKDFNNLVIGQTTSQIFTITNSGTADLSITNFALSGANANEFSHNGTAQTIAPNGTYDVTVTFAPTSIGNKVASLDITDNDGNHTVALSGSGTTDCVVSIPDANFKAYLVGNSSINTNGNSEIECSEAQSYTGTINCSNNSISDLTGIETFVNITELNFNDNSVATVNLSQNTKLKKIFCWRNNLTALNVSNNIELTNLVCWQNSITSLDVSNNTALTSFYCRNNQLTSIDVTNNTALQYFDCGNNDISTLNISQNTALLELGCYGNELNVINVSNNTALTSISAGNNPIPTINTSNNLALKVLKVNSSPSLTSLDVSNNTALEKLYCHQSKLTTLDVSNNTALIELNCSSNQITSLDVSINTALTKLYCSANQLICLNVANGNNTNMTNMTAINNTMLSCIQKDTAFDPTTNTNWTKDTTANWSDDCQIPAFSITPTSKDFQLLTVGQTISQNFEITNTGCADLILSNFTLTGDTTEFSHNGTNNTTLVSGETYTVTVNFNPTSAGAKTATLTITDNTSTPTKTVALSGEGTTTCIVYIPDTNFKNELVNNTAINTNGNTQIECTEAQAFDGEINVYNKNIADLTGIEAFTSLTKLNCGRNQLTSINVSANTALTNLSVNRNSLTSLDVSNNTALESLYFTYNKVNAIDLTNNIALKSLGAYGNNLTALDVSQNTLLTYLHCYQNQLTSLDVSTNTALTSLHFGNNQISNIDLSANTALRYLIASENLLTTLNVSNQTLLHTLGAQKNQLVSIDVSNNPSLKRIILAENNLTSIDVSNNTKLEELYVNKNSLSLLDLNVNVKLKKVLCSDNQLTTLNVTNGNNGVITHMKAQNNPNLTCIQHDTNFDPTTNSNWAKDSTANWSVDCDIPQLTIAPTSRKNFRNLSVGQTRTQVFTITNNGTADLSITSFTLNGANASDFSHNGTAQTIAPNGTYDITVTFAPTSAGDKTASLVILNNTSLGTHTIELTGKGTVSPQYSITPISKNFGDVQVGQTATQIFTITNNGSADLVISAFTLSGNFSSEFSHNGTAQTIPPNGTYNVTVTFTPTSVGTKEMNLINTGNTGNHTVALTGSGTTTPTPQFTITPINKDFGDVQVGQTATQQFTITNNGTADLVINTIDITGNNPSEFNHNGTTQTIASNTSYQFTVTFSPTNDGNKSASIAITDNAGNHNVALTGNGTATPTAQFTIAPINKDFGDVQVGQIATQQFTITNNGTADLVINTIDITGNNPSEFSHDGTTQTIDPNTSYQFTVTFAPTNEGNKSASITITDNAGNHNVALTGNGTTTPTPQFTITPINKDFGDVQIGQTATQQFTITNNGTADLVINTIDITGNNPSEFSHDGTTQTVAPNTSYQFTVTFSPAIEGSKSASIAITDNTGNHTVAIIGNATPNIQQEQTITWTGETTVEIGCGGENNFIIDATTNSNLQLVYEIVNTTIATLDGNIVRFNKPGTTIIRVSQPGNSGYSAAQPVLKTITYRTNALIQQHWDDTLFFDNSSEEYTSWQWYKNGESIPGATKQYYYENTPLSGDYYVIARTKGGEIIETCSLAITTTFTSSITVAPNPVNANEMFTVKTKYTNTDLKDAKLIVVSTAGKVIYQTTDVNASTQVKAPNASGIYIVSLQLSNGKNYSTNLIVR